MGTLYGYNIDSNLFGYNIANNAGGMSMNCGWMGSGNNTFTGGVFGTGFSSNFGMNGNMGYFGGPTSWNNMNNAALYRFPNIQDNSPFGFSVPTESSYTAIDKMCATGDLSAFSLRNIDDTPLSFGTTNANFTSFGNNGGFVQNQAQSGFSSVPTNHGIYDNNAYQKYLDSILGTNMASSLSVGNQNQTQQSTKQTSASGQNPSSADENTPQEMIPEYEKEYRKKEEEGEISRDEQEVLDKVNNLPNALKDMSNSDDIIADLIAAFDANEEEAVMEILNKNMHRIGDLEILYMERTKLLGAMRSLREDIASTFPVNGFGWATERYSPTVNKWLNILDEKAISHHPRNAALALRQAINDGVFGFRVNQERITKILNDSSMTPAYLRAVKEEYRNLTQSNIIADINAKWFVSSELKKLVREKFSSQMADAEE